MSGWLQVAPADLHVSAALVDDHACAVAAGHGAADAELAGAQAALAGISAAAVAEKAAHWQTVTAVLGARLAEHGASLSSGAVSYQLMDEVTNADRLREVVSDALGNVEG